MSGLSVTPIKGFRIQQVDSIFVDPGGVRGDRDMFIVDASDRLLSITRTGALAACRESGQPRRDSLIARDGDIVVRGELTPGEPVHADFYGHHRVGGHFVDGPWNELLSDLAGRPVRLAQAAATEAGWDIRPITLLGTASLAELSRRVDRPVDARRFRMLIELRTETPHEEDDWEGALLTGDEAVIRVLGRVPRCAAITRHPEHGDRDLALVKAIRAYRGCSPPSSVSGSASARTRRWCGPARSESASGSRSAAETVARSRGPAGYLRRSVPSRASNSGRRPRGPADPQRPARIAQAALQVAAQEGISALTHRAVARAADVPIGSTTYYFHSLEALIGAVLKLPTSGTRTRSPLGPRSFGRTASSSRWRNCWQRRRSPGRRATG